VRSGSGRRRPSVQPCARLPWPALLVQLVEWFANPAYSWLAAASEVSYCFRMGRFLGIVGVILVLFWIISAPASAAAAVSGILALLASFASSIIAFVQNLVVTA
jgi:hypothetical protein